MQESVRNSVIIVSMAETPCEMMVAYATPSTPMPSDSTGTKIENNVEYGGDDEEIERALGITTARRMPEPML